MQEFVLYLAATASLF